VSDSKRFIWTHMPEFALRVKTLCLRFISMDDEQLEDFNKRCSAWLKRCQTADGITQIIKIISVLAEDRKFEDQLNSCHHLIPLQRSMVFNIRNGEYRRRRMTDYFSQTMNFSFMPDAMYNIVEEEDGEEVWQDVRITDVLVEEVALFMMELGCEDPHWACFMWQYLGYCLTGYTQDRSYVIWQGVGANGKSALVNAMSAVMGQFYTTCAENFFALTSHGRDSAENASPFMASLRYTRALFLAETSTNFKPNMTKIKSITGGDAQTARKLYGSPQKFVPQLKFNLVTNFLPAIDCSDQAAVDRFLAIAFSQRYVRDNPTGNEKLADSAKANRLKDQLKDAFGTYLCHGAHAMFINTKGCRTGLTRPACIANHTKIQLENADLLSAFIRQASERGNNFTWSAVDMWRDFTAWANVRRSEMQDIVLDAFIKQIQGKSFKHIVYKRRQDGSGVFVGIRKLRSHFSEFALDPIKEFSSEEEAEDSIEFSS